MKNVSPKCVLVLVTDGFEELEMIAVISSLRQAGLCIKSVGLTSGLVSGTHGVWLMPDLTLADVDRFTKTVSISALILPEGHQALSQLEVDPRVHRLLRQVVAGGGQVVVGAEGRRLFKLSGEGAGYGDDFSQVSVLLREPGQSPESLARSLLHQWMKN